MDAAFMLLRRHGWDIHAVSRSQGQALGGNLSWRSCVVGVRSAKASRAQPCWPDNSIGGDRFRLRWSNQGKRAEGCGCDLVNPVAAKQYLPTRSRITSPLPLKAS